MLKLKVKEIQKSKKIYLMKDSKMHIYCSLARVGYNISTVQGSEVKDNKNGFLSIISVISKTLLANSFSLARGRTIFETNIFSKFGNFFLAPDLVSPQGRVEYTLIFQSLSLRDQKLKNRNNPVL